MRIGLPRARFNYRTLRMRIQFPYQRRAVYRRATFAGNTNPVTLRFLISCDFFFAFLPITSVKEKLHRHVCCVFVRGFVFSFEQAQGAQPGRASSTQQQQEDPDIEEAKEHLSISAPATISINDQRL